MVTTVTYPELKGVLSDTELPHIKEPYYIIHGQNEGNVTILASGRNGDEYNKTIGTIHIYAEIVNFTCLYGQGLLMLQRFDDSGETKEVKLFSLRPGKMVEIPSGYAHVIINTGKHFLVTLDNLISNPKFLKNDPIMQNHGLAYYVIEKKGEISIEKNPEYKYPPQISME